MLVAHDGVWLGALFDRTLGLVPRFRLHLDFRSSLGLAALPLWQLDLPCGPGLVLAAWRFFHLVACACDVVPGAWLG